MKGVNACFHTPHASFIVLLPVLEYLLCSYVDTKNIIPGCTGTSLVSFCSGAIPSGRQESGTAGAECD